MKLIIEKNFDNLAFNKGFTTLIVKHTWCNFLMIYKR